MPVKLNKNQILEILKETKFVLKSEFINTRKSMIFYCEKCKSTFERKLSFIIDGFKCPCCKAKEIVNYRKTYLLEYNYILLDEEYKLQNKPMKLECPKGHICNISWDAFYNRNVRCKFCKKEEKDIYHMKNNELLVDMYGYKLLNQNYNCKNNRETILKLICKNNNSHVFEIKVFSLKYNSNIECCPFCSGHKVLDEDILKYIEKEGYSLSQIKRDDKNIWITIQCCEKHDIYETSWSCFKSGSRCKKCLVETLKLSYEYVKEYVEGFNYKLLSDEYINAREYLDIMCDKGHIYSAPFDTFKTHKCPNCALLNNKGENASNWQGGITEIQKYLRSCVVDWKKESIKNCNYKCVITNERFYDVHHLYGFDLILQETLNITNIKIKPIVSDYTKEELQILENTVKHIHSKYPLGVCIGKDLHTLFHQEYGYGNNIPEQFEEFKTRLKSGEFNLFLEENSLKLLI